MVGECVACRRSKYRVLTGPQQFISSIYQPHFPFNMFSSHHSVNTGPCFGLGLGLSTSNATTIFDSCLDILHGIMFRDYRDPMDIHISCSRRHPTSHRSVRALCYHMEHFICQASAVHRKKASELRSQIVVCYCQRSFYVHLCFFGIRYFLGASARIWQGQFFYSDPIFSNSLVVSQLNG